jgi:hypothetical protein
MRFTSLCHSRSDAGTAKSSAIARQEMARAAIVMEKLSPAFAARAANWRRPHVVISTAVTIALAIAAGFERCSSEPHAVTTERVAPSAICQEADREAVTHFVAILERNRPTDAPVIERSVYALNIARRHCLYGWNHIASKQYEWLEHWLDEHK